MVVGQETARKAAVIVLAWAVKDRVGGVVVAVFVASAVGLASGVAVRVDVGVALAVAVGVAVGGDGAATAMSTRPWFVSET